MAVAIGIHRQSLIGGAGGLALARAPILHHFRAVRTAH